MWFLLLAAFAIGYVTADTTSFMLSPDFEVHRLIFAALCAGGMLVFEVLFVGFILNMMVMCSFCWVITGVWYGYHCFIGIG